MSTMKVYFATNRNLRTGSVADQDTLVSPTRPRFGRYPSDFRVGTAEVRITPGDPVDGHDVAAEARFQSAEVSDERQRKDGSFARKGSDEIFPALLEDLAKQQMAGDTVRWSALVFIHGYDFTFEEAMERGALLAHVYATATHKFIPFVFSWPSDGDRTISAYHSDREDAALSGCAAARALSSFITFIAAQPVDKRCITGSVLVAHSMGTYALAHGLQFMIDNHKPIPQIFETAILAGSDEDHSAFMPGKRLSALHRLTRQVAIYINRYDKALIVSDALPGKVNRLGHFGPGPTITADYAVPLSVLRCERVDYWGKDLTRHQYYRMAPGVVADIKAVLEGQDADRIAGRERIGVNDYRLG